MKSGTSQSTVVRATGDLRSLAAGVHFALVDHEVDVYNTDYAVIAIQHMYTGNQFQSGGGAFTSAVLNEFARHRDTLATELARESLLRSKWWCVCDAASGDAARIVSAMTAAGLLPVAATPEADFHVRCSLEDEQRILRERMAAAATTALPVQQLSMPTDTSFAAFVRPTGLSLQHPDHASVTIATQIVKSEFFHHEVREKGGAYGAFSQFGNTGMLSHVSYRDPQPARSLDEVFSKTEAWLASAQSEPAAVDGQTAEQTAAATTTAAAAATATVTEAMVEHALLRAFAGIDAPRSAASFGDRRFLHGMTEEQRQARRERLLAVTASDVRRVAAPHFSSCGASMAIVTPQDKVKAKE